METKFVLSQCIGFLKTPPTWLDEEFGIQQFNFPKIQLTNLSLNPIPQKIRLGHQMEHVFKQLIEHSPNYDLLLHNLPIRRGKQTLGEIDFILKDVVTKKLIHIELTYKFYIINPEISEPINRLIGPNRRDMFSLKIEKIKSKQFKLLHSKEGIHALANKNISHDSISHKVCFKAQLFKPYGVKTSNIGPLNQDCICGFWLRYDDFNTSEFKSYQFYIPNKSEWVIEPHALVKWTSHSETLLDLDIQMLKENAPMVWLKKSDTEFEKFFVVWWN